MAAVLTAVSLAATPIVAHADHLNPETGEPCHDKHLVYKKHTGVYGGYQLPPHMMRDGRYCTPNRLGLIHLKQCTCCEAEVDGFVIECEERHTLCGSFKIGMGH